MKCISNIVLAISLLCSVQSFAGGTVGSADNGASSLFKGDYYELKNLAKQETLVCGLEMSDGTGVNGAATIIYGTTAFRGKKLAAFMDIQGTLLSVKTLTILDLDNAGGKTYLFTLNNLDGSKYTDKDFVTCRVL